MWQCHQLVQRVGSSLERLFLSGRGTPADEVKFFIVKFAGHRIGNPGLVGSVTAATLLFSWSRREPMVGPRPRVCAGLHLTM